MRVPLAPLFGRSVESGQLPERREERIEYARVVHEIGKSAIRRRGRRRHTPAKLCGVRPQHQPQSEKEAVQPVKKAIFHDAVPLMCNRLILISFAGKYIKRCPERQNFVRRKFYHFSIIQNWLLIKRIRHALIENC